MYKGLSPFGPRGCSLWRPGKKGSCYPVLFFRSLDVLWEEGKAALEQLLKFMVHPAISSINLTTALGSLANIARQRPMFMSEVIQAYETLHGRLSPLLPLSTGQSALS